MSLAEVNAGRHIVFAYDPGKVTGWACYDPSNESWVCGQTDGRFAFYRQFEQTIAYGGTVEVVGEKFTIGEMTKGKTSQYDALYINGTIEYLSDKLGFPLKLQTVTGVKNFATDSKLKAVGWYHATKGGHANDANRHLLTYLATTRRAMAGDTLLAKIAEEFNL